MFSTSSSSIYASLRRSKIKCRVCAGENNPRWKGGVSSKWDHLHTDPAYKQWQLGVFKRDHYQCMLCRVKGRDLHAHHVHPKYMAPDRILDLTNGVTVCEECHNKLINGFEEELIRLFEAVLKVHRPASERVYQILFKNKFEIPPRLCACGCGKYTRMTGRIPNEFIRGHAIRVQGMTEETKQKIADAQRFGDEMIAHAQRLYDSGQSTIEVASTMGVSQAWVHKVIKTRSASAAQRLRFQDPDQRKRPKKELPLDKIMSDYAEGRGLNPFELAAKYGITHMTIRSRLREAGVYPRPGSEKFINKKQTESSHFPT